MKKYHLQTLLNVQSLCGLLNHENYNQKLEILSGSSIGQHIRHIVEFYICLFTGYNTGTVNYDNRERNLLIVNLPEYAVSTLEDIKNQLIGAHMDKSINLDHMLGDETFTLQTTLARELYYLAEHSIHHFALIKIGFSTSFPEISLPQNFGVADSTVRHHANLECAS